MNTHFGSRSGFLAAALLGLTGCGHYADFTLPLAPGGAPRATYVFEAKPEPVMARGQGWEAGDVLNPSVVRGERGIAPLSYNFYSGFDGHVWRTGLATSGDGERWDRKGAFLSPDPRTWESSYIAANGSALLYEGRFWYWYQSGVKDAPRIGLATCREGDDCAKPASWRKEPKPVLDYGPYASWDERAVADPYVIRAGAYFYLYYLGQDRARRQRLGVARSRDGVRWEKLRANPLLELGAAGAFDEMGLGEPAVWNAQGYYWMLYTGRDAHEYRRLGLARSVDGVNWTKLPAVFAGQQPWNSKVLCDPTVLPGDGPIPVWFGGGDVASPDENLNGQIGAGLLHPALQEGK
jgi:predicted GH43/DUF377 family glycosyl hydrolase